MQNPKQNFWQRITNQPSLLLQNKIQFSFSVCIYTCHQNLKISLNFALLPCQLKPGYANFCVLMFHTLQEC